jgi:hypothetical protein
MTSEYIGPGTSSKEISVFIENDPNIKEGNENNFAYPQNLYILFVIEKRCKYRIHESPLYKY